MATRKVKRYNGEEDSDVSSFAGTPENDSNAGMKEAYDAGMSEKEPGWDTKESAPAAPKQRIVSKEELAKSGLSLRDFLNKERGLTRRDGSTPAPAAAKPATTTRSAATRGDDTANPDVKQGPKKGQYMTLQDRAREYERARAASGTGMYGTKKSEPAETKKTPGRGVIDTKNIRENTLLPTRGMKRGGSVSSASSRADGIATRGKTKCKMR